MTGVTVVLTATAATAAVDVRGGAPGTRETDALGLSGIVEEVHGVVLSGGSAFGLDGAGGVEDWLARRNVGFAVGQHRIPIVPQAILFDLSNGGDKGGVAPDLYRKLAHTACNSAAADFEIGSSGAGFGATTATLRGGLGSASAIIEDGRRVGALVAVNPLGSVTIGDGPQFWAGALEYGREFGGLGWPERPALEGRSARLKNSGGTNTTVAVVATDARLTKPECHRLAVMAQTGMARAIHPVHTPLDGDTVFALATGHAAPPRDHRDLAQLGAAAADCLARAIARAVFSAAPAPPGWAGPPAYRTRFPEHGP